MNTSGWSFTARAITTSTPGDSSSDCSSSRSVMRETAAHTGSPDVLVAGAPRRTYETELRWSFSAAELVESGIGDQALEVRDRSCHAIKAVQLGEQPPPANAIRARRTSPIPHAAGSVWASC